MQFGCKRNALLTILGAMLEERALGWLIGRVRRRALRLFVSCVVLLTSSRLARANIPGDCSALGLAITEHSCFHAEFGPFSTVASTPGVLPAAKTPDLNPVHTEYRVGLAGAASVVTYTPERTGAWAVLLGAEVPVSLAAGQTPPLEPMLSQAENTGCKALPVLHVFRLTAKTKYRLVFGPTELRQLAVVIEYIDDFLTQNGRDVDGDGFGSAVDFVVTPCTPPAGFAPNARDCDDGDSSVNPGSLEVCDGIDQNCNGVADDLGLVCHVGSGACRSEGVTRCEVAGDTASCTAKPLEKGKETCNGLDDDCSGAIDDGPDLCPDPSRPTCVRSGVSASCGCLLDVDCGAVTSGRICETATRTCIAGCSELPGGNGCAAGEICEVARHRCQRLDVDGGAAGASGGAPAQAGVGGAPAPAGAGGAPQPPEDPVAGAPAAADGTTQRVSAGCGCAVAGAQPHAPRAVCSSLLLGVLWLRSRRRWTRRGRAGLLSVLLAALAGCSGTSVTETNPSGSAGDSHQHPGHGGGSGSTSQPAGGAAADCQPTLGEELIEHSCIHASKGPFVDVVAGGALPPADASELHHTYQVQVVAEHPLLRYRAQRDGEHAFLTNLPTRIRLSKAGAALSEPDRFPVEGCKPLKWATVQTLEQSAVYDVELVDAPREVNLFIEHLGAFGSAAWSEKCEETEP